MAAHGPIAFAGDPWKPFSRENLLALGLSLPVQLTAGAAFGHPYDMRIFMTTDGWKDPSLSFPFRFYTQLGML